MSRSDVKHRTRLAQQMMRDLPAHEPSEEFERMINEPPPADSTNSSLAFDPDNDAVLTSTRLLDSDEWNDDSDTSTFLIEMRDSARKYRRYHPPEPAIPIDTSALANAFPDFTQAGPSSESIMSVETGRGYQHEVSNGAGHQQEYKDNSYNIYSNKTNDSLADMSSSKNQGHMMAPHAPKTTQHPSLQQAPKMNTAIDKSGLMDFSNLKGSKLMTTPVKLSQSKKGTATVEEDYSELFDLSAKHEQAQPSPVLAKTTNYGSAGSRNSSQEQKRNPAAYHARVRDEADDSYGSDHHPTASDLTVRKTRFGSPNGKIPKPLNVPANFSLAQGFIQTAPQKESQVKYSPTTMQTPSEQRPNVQHLETQPSYMYPSSFPELSELVTGIYNDGTPVFSQASKPRASRFTSAKDGKGMVDPHYANVDEIALPMDEQDIMMKLQFLQDRVRYLEEERADFQVSIEELQEKNLVLKQEKTQSRKWRHSDSALGSTDGSDLQQDEARSSRRSLIERTRLEAGLRLLKEQYDAEKRKTIVLDVVIKNLTQDRDAATSQLGVAFFSMEQLKNENLRLRDQISHLESELRSKIDHIAHFLKLQEADLAPRDGFEHTDDLVQCLKEAILDTHGVPPEANPVSSSKEQSLPQTDVVSSDQEKSFTSRFNFDAWEHTDDFIQDMKKMDAAVQSGKRELSSSNGNNSKQTTIDVVIKGNKIASAVIRNSPSDAHKTKSDKIQPPPADQTSQNAEKEVLTRARRNSNGVRQPDFESKASQTDRVSSQTDRERGKFIIGEISFVSDTDEISISEQASQRSEERKLNSRDNTVSSEPFGKRQVDNEVSEAGTYLTAFADKDISEMRANLEKERHHRKQLTAAANHKSPTIANVKGKSSPRVSEDPSLPKEPRTISLKIPANNGKPDTSHSNISGKHNRRHSEDSLLMQRNKRQGLGTENMTSAFIVPDITMRLPGKTVSAPNLPKAKKQEEQKRASYGNVVYGEHHSRKEKVKKTVKIPKPVPVSECMPEPSKYEDEPTLRPSQPPGNALARVIHALENENAHKKRKLSRYQALYNDQNPAAGMRERQKLVAKIHNLVEIINEKSNQIYYLYDVLEGQKTAGQEMNDEEIDITLQSIGLDYNQMELRGGDLPKEDCFGIEDHSWNVSTSSSEGLPWEGIENSTVETTGSRRSKAHSHTL
ncbi:MAG: hypothetical protein MMC33_004803 [Icmadophila ericetorum]|nr:hypothetical protein [Icmadophila ericetorum]